MDKRTGKIRALAVDHDHKTGKVRALLCRNCNTGLGNFQDSPELLKTAIQYLEEEK
jgi:dihydroorotase-like cyclic amidohydrolase